jgi:hypothetical protein
MLTEAERARCVENLLESHKTKIQGPRPSYGRKLVTA